MLTMILEWLCMTCGYEINNIKCPNCGSKPRKV